MGDLFEDSTDSSILIVTTCGFAASVSGQQRASNYGVQGKTQALLIALAQVIWRRKLAERTRVCGVAGHPVKFNEEVAVASENKGDVHTLACGVEFGLFQPVIGGQRLSFGLDERHCHRLGLADHLDPQYVIDASM